MKGYIKIRQSVLDILETKLPDNLYYHSIDHTLDVLKVCNEYIDRLNIDEDQAKLLRLGALLHDVGFTVSNIDHEERGVEISQKLLSEYDMPQEDIDIIHGLIRATKIPQSPKTELEKIICDSDLDYLGRNNFYNISDQLFKELQSFDVVHDKNEWNKMQIRFLEAHSYHTPFAREHRQPVKEKRIAELKKMVEESGSD